LELIEITGDSYEPSRKGDAVLWNDRHYENLTTTDGVDISSRSKQRAYMKRHGLATYDDFKGEFERREADRAAYRTGERGSVSRQDIARAIDRLMNR
jgi:hypothetical protein